MVLHLYSPPKFTIFVPANEAITGVGRLLRAIVVDTGEFPDYEFVHVDREDSADALKEIPLRQIPALFVDGIYLVGLATICRNLSARIGLHGSTLLEDGRVDMLGELLIDTVERLNSLKDSGDLDRSFMEDSGIPTDSSSDNHHRPTLTNVGVDAFLEAEVYGNVVPFLEECLTKSDGKFLVGGQETWADLLLDYFFETINLVCAGHAEPLEKFRNLFQRYKCFSNKYDQSKSISL